MSSDTPTYQYDVLRPASSPNGQIRLLVLEPGEFGSPIHCRLQTVGLHAHPPFEALSYTWGSPLGKQSRGYFNEGPKSITLDNVTRIISSNLGDALQRIRYTLSERVLWVDALCINQKDDAEKSEQVKAMAKIYKEACLVLAWLGDDCGDDVELAFDTLQDLISSTTDAICRYCANQVQLPLSNINSDHVKLVITSELKALDKKGSSMKSSPFRDLLQPLPMAGLVKSVASLQASSSSTSIGLHRSRSAQWARSDETRRRLQAIKAVFEDRSYWTRRWVVQETTVASELYFLCGSRQLDFAMLGIFSVLNDAVLMKQHSLYCLFDDYVRRLGVEVYQLLLECYELADLSPDRKLSTLLTNHYIKRCSDPSDVIFALLSISTSTNIQIDYSRSTVDIYTEATRSMIDEDGSLNVIGMSIKQLHAQETPEYLPLPSWVPHFERITHLRQLYGMGPAEDQQFRCGGPLQVLHTHQDIANNLKILHIQGSFCGMLRKTGRRINFRVYRDDLRNMLTGLTSLVCRMRGLGVVMPGSNGHYDIWRAFINDTYLDSDYLYHRRISHNEQARENFNRDYNKAIDSDLPARLCDQMRFSLMNSTICLTTEGAIARVYGDVKPGDRIFAARGADYPFILRPADTEQHCILKQKHPGKEFATFVGGAYVEGIMDGEVFSGRGFFDKIRTRLKKPKDVSVYLV